MTRKLPALLILPLFLFIFATVVNAVEDSSTESAKPTTTVTAETTASSASKLREQVLLREKNKTAIAKVKDAKDEVKAEIQAKKEEFKAKVKTIKDQKKKALILKIDAKLIKINLDQTRKLSDALTRIQGFLDKIKQSTVSANTTIDTAIAQKAIDVAKTALDTQAAKTYTMEIVDDTTLKENAGATISQLRLDLTAVHKLIVDAKQAVQKLKIEKSEIEKEATSSAEDKG